MEFPNNTPKVDNVPAVGCQWKVRARGEDIRGFVLSNVEKHPNDIASLAAVHFSITRQAINKHLKKLVAEKALVSKGRTRDRVYGLASVSEWSRAYEIRPGLEEDQAWAHDISLVLGKLPQ